MKIAVPCLLAASLAVSCRPLKPITLYPGDIGVYKSAVVAWSPVNEKEQAAQSSFIFYQQDDSLLKREINTRLTQRGFKTAGEKAVLFVNYCVLEEEKLSPLSMTYKERYGKKAFYSGNYPDSSKEWLFMLKSKTLIVDLMDVKTNQLVWRGWATTTDGSGDKKQPGIVKEMVEEIFKQFPASLK